MTVEEPTEEEAVRILEGIKGKYEDHHHVQITPEAIEAAVRLSTVISMTEICRIRPSI